MSYHKDYGHGGTMSSSGKKEEYKAGTPYSGRGYKRDMYDDLAPYSKTATTEPNNGIQGSTSAGMSGNTGDKSKSVDSESSMGKKDYGKGNPYKDKRPGQGKKPNTSAKPKKQKFQSLDELRDYARKFDDRGKGYGKGM